MIFRLEVNYVEVDAVVSDEQGNFVDDLTLDDFEVLEDGEVQDVTAFSLVNIPVERADRPLFADSPIEPDVRSNERPFDGRVFVLTLDDLQTTPLQTSYVKAAAKEFIERHLGANDLTAVVFTSGRTDAAQGFTDSRRLLLNAVDKFVGQGERSGVLTRTDTFYRRLGQEPQVRVRDELDSQRGQKARATLSTLRALSQWLGGVRGRRKAVVFISRGIDYDIYDFINAPLASTIVSEMRRTIGAATQANVALYTLDPRGMASGVSDEIEVGIIPDDLSTGGNTGLHNDSLRYDLRLAQDSLQVLADETGGMAFVNTNDLNGAFDRIVQDSSAYYVLGYYPSNDRRDGKSRTIDVRVNRPGLVVRARTGYLAPSGNPPDLELAEAGTDTSRALREVMTNPLPVSGLGLSVSAMPFMGERPNTSLAVVIEFNGDDLKFTERDGRFENTLELNLTVLDPEGKIRGGQSQSLELELQRATYEAITRYGLRVVARFDLEPGRYQVRVASHETNGGAVGSVHYDVDVPDFSDDDDLQISGLALTSAVASRTPSARPDPGFEDVLPAMPTTQREFLRGDELYLFVDVYDTGTRTEHRVDITTTVREDTGQIVFSTTEERSSKEIGRSRGGYGHVTQIPLIDVEPGLYVLRTEARSRLDPDTIVSRELQFVVLDLTATGTERR